MILMNDETVIKDLLEKRGHTYAARPDLFIREFGGNMNIAFREYASFQDALIGLIVNMSSAMTMSGDGNGKCTIFV